MRQRTHPCLLKTAAISKTNMDWSISWKENYINYRKLNQTNPHKLFIKMLIIKHKHVISCISWKEHPMEVVHGQFSPASRTFFLGLKSLLDAGLTKNVSTNRRTCIDQWAHANGAAEHRLLWHHYFLLGSVIRYLPPLAGFTKFLFSYISKTYILIFTKIVFLYIKKCITLLRNNYDIIFM